jgi:hypothetical protein
MMKLFCLTFTFIVLALTAHTQKALNGTWYAKIENEPFPKSVVYLKKEISGSKRILKIDSSFRYTYIEPPPKAIETTGTAGVSGDTLYFKRDNSSDTMRLFIYHLDSSQLIYSFRYLPKYESRTGDTHAGSFTRVEVEAKYRNGENSFYKALYRQLANDKPQDSIATKELEFIIIIGVNGKPEINSVEARNDDSKPFVSSIKTAFSKMNTGFVPAQQNGKTVRSYYAFSINY